ncbi:hypothetical protein BC332_15686 [Capsicum chinense]|nr:hypothetical protein BC332_15686 [Capsicum chinense]
MVHQMMKDMNVVIEHIFREVVLVPYWVQSVKKTRTGEINNHNRVQDIRRKKHGTYLDVTTYEKAHSCSVDFIASDHRNATSKVIYDYILELVHDSSNVITPNFVVDEMRKKYGIIISYNKGWRAIQHAYSVIRGTAEENYNRLSSYLHMMKENNPSTYINIKRDDENRDEDEADMTEVKLLFDVLMTVLLAWGEGGRVEICERMEKAIP